MRRAASTLIRGVVHLIIIAALFLGVVLAVSAFLSNTSARKKKTQAGNGLGLPGFYSTTPS